MKRLFLLPTLCVLLTACNRDPYSVSNPDPNHTHADLMVFIQGEMLDLSDEKYMSGVPTEEGEHDDEHDDDDSHDPYLHLHDGVGHVIHRHKPDLTIGEFFATLGMNMEPTCFTLDTGEKYCNEGVGQQGNHWMMFVQGIEVPFNPDFVFLDLDQILLMYDDHVDELLFDEVTDDSCLYSKRCPWRGEPPAENCISDPAIPCVVPEEDL